jgi:hypothetical protein
MFSPEGDNLSSIRRWAGSDDLSSDRGTLGGSTLRAGSTLGGSTLPGEATISCLAAQSFVTLTMILQELPSNEISLVIPTPIRSMTFQRRGVGTGII